MGSHSAIKSGMLAAEAVFDAVVAGRAGDELRAYPEAYRRSWLSEERYRARNFKPLMSERLWWSSLMFGIDQTLLRGKASWIFHLTPDPERSVPAIGGMDMNFAGKTIFISGGSRGIGLAIALRAARDRANIALAAKTAEPHAKIESTHKENLYGSSRSTFAAGVFGPAPIPTLKLSLVDCEI
jgi:hypothetical protein